MFIPAKLVNYDCCKSCILCLRTRSSCPNERLELVHVACLHVNRARTSEATDEALASLETTHKTATSLFDFVVAAPSHEVAVVYNMLLPGLKLLICLVKKE